MSRALRVIASTLLLGVACGPAEGEPSAPLVVDEGGCQPLLASTVRDEASRAGCLLPYPSDFHVIEDRSTSTGRRVVLGAAARPHERSGEEVDPHAALPSDGFSLVPTIVATLPSAITREGLPSILDDPRVSASVASPTLLVDTSSGALVPHYVDLARSADDLHRPIVLRPFAPLSPRTRYVVALRGVRTDAGALAPAPPGFARLRDRDGGRDPSLAAIAARFDEEVFAALERAGATRGELQLAWDFTTGSAEEPRRDMLEVRRLTLAWLAANTPAVTITKSTQGDERFIEGTMTGPLFLTDDRPLARLHRGEGGAVTANGTTTFSFRITVPKTLAAGPPGHAIAVGHGFFGDASEVQSGNIVTIAERTRAIAIGVDWWGMSKADIGPVTNAMGETPDHATDFAERVHQAMANWLVAIAALRGPLLAAPELKRPDGAAVYDPSFVAYFGASQGHILGGTLIALAPEIARAVLNVGGGGFTHLMPRSANFGPFSLILDTALGDPLFVQGAIAMMQRSLDRIDPLTYAPLVVREPLEGSAPDRRVLLQTGLGDAQVPNIGSFLHARALGASLDQPSPQDVFGLPPRAEGDRVALTLFDFGIDTSPTREATPLGQNPVHSSVRGNPAALRQIEALLRPDGTIVHACDGACDPE